MWGKGIERKERRGWLIPLGVHVGMQDVDFEAENQALRNQNADLRAENEDLSLLVQDYETVLEKVLEGLRVYAVRHSFFPGMRIVWGLLPTIPRRCRKHVLIHSMAGATKYSATTPLLQSTSTRHIPISYKANDSRTRSCAKMRQRVRRV